MGRLCSYQHKPPFKNMRASVLCFAFFTSNQIPFALGTCPLSPECAFRAAQTCHNEDTVRSFTQSETSFLVKLFAFLLLSLKAELGLIKSLSYLFVCFSPCRLFLENRPLRMCKLRSYFGDISPHQGSLKLSDA